MYTIVIGNLYVAAMGLVWNYKHLMKLKARGKLCEFFSLKHQRAHAVLFIGMSAWNHVFYLSVDAGGSRGLLGWFGNNLFAVLCDWYLLVGYLTLGVAIDVTLKASTQLMSVTVLMKKTIMLRVFIAGTLLVITIVQAAVKEVQAIFPILDGIVYILIGLFYLSIVKRFDNIPGIEDSPTLLTLFAYAKLACYLTFVNVAIIGVNKTLLHAVHIGAVGKMLMFFILNINHLILVYILYKAMSTSVGGKKNFLTKFGTKATMKTAATVGTARTSQVYPDPDPESQANPKFAAESV